MRGILTIAGREVRSSFATPLAYVIIGGFLVLSGFFFFSLLQQFNSLVDQIAMRPDVVPNLNEWVVFPYYQTLLIVLLFLMPILTMRAIADERRMGTFEMLVTSPIRSADIVLGKFLGISTITLVMLVLSFCFPLVLIIFTDVEVLPMLVGLAGLLLFSAACISLGIAVSSFTRNQTVAGVLTLILLLLFYMIDAPADRLSPGVQEFVRFLAPSGHAENLLKGFVTGSDLVYFLSVILLGIFVANRVLDAQNWR